MDTGSPAQRDRSSKTHAAMRSGASPLSASNQLLSGDPEIEAASGLEGFCKQPHFQDLGAGRGARYPIARLTSIPLK